MKNRPEKTKKTARGNNEYQKTENKKKTFPKLE
jgi:hypothetical protein